MRLLPLAVPRCTAPSSPRSAPLFPCRDALIRTAEPDSHTSATIQLIPPATPEANVTGYICVLCLLRSKNQTAGAARASTGLAGWTCPYGDAPKVQECPTTTCQVTGLTAGKPSLLPLAGGWSSAAGGCIRQVQPTLRTNGGRS